MNQEIWTAVDSYLSNMFIPSVPILEEVLAANKAAGLPAHDVSPQQGKFLQILARMQKAASILEIGTLGAYSSIWLAQGLAKGGRVISLEVDTKHAEIARRNAAFAGLSEVIEVRLGPALESLPVLFHEKRKPFDLIFIDADKRNNPAYFEWSLKLSRPGGLIIVDNVIRSGAVLDANSSDPDVQGVRRLHEMLASENRVCASVIQTVGCKGYDGFLLALVLEPSE